MTSDRPLTRLGFLTIGLFDEHDPAGGHENTLRMIELGEQLGFDSAWVRQRHLQHGISSPVAVLAAATQRTRRIALGTAVIPLGLENPFRLAEDLATVDVLSGGRLNPGISVGRPTHFKHIGPSLYPDTADREDFTHARVDRLLHLLRGGTASTFTGTEGIETYSERIQPYSPGLAGRVWYGAAGLSSVARAAGQGLNLLTSSVVRAEEDDDFARVQASHIRRFRELHPLGERARVSQGLVVVPTDTATAEQRARYAAYAEARLPRTREPQGPGRILFSPDLVGPAAEIADRLHGDPAFRQVDEVAFALPFTFGYEDYVQILTDIAERLAPLLGWTGPAPA
ncbi:Flavin-dependent oxidoreductase, luciferase family (includes alkanesulfonate monooxygenase SsuD and methylene tetrahydromethanopterin reductase) [Nocardiopsis flavescens]|uniref:Flavin-dependent oxidoreductase, luciferase family (Includes alkanesulfonate monooxygenase SsuD and methylene tetrahydromethanopterin reductase) n=1 Tax=Nocardiopsis flavescens TaxID=758803 RepID=A0A1M6JBU9_9ACTN|nr:LLM class flavin-dependent oxidoreductase [Nocardiopsis flavescens]SHJ44206.1 Flavin-dependent oxidoreductase, luciferase family (includes alkanesulfonate monooxygenase SsuD and methylene tetrahydromethanopterin reductase) [Nocardiopsis flavescens]